MTIGTSKVCHTFCKSKYLTCFPFSPPPIFSVPGIHIQLIKMKLSQMSYEATGVFLYSGIIWAPLSSCWGCLRYGCWFIWNLFLLVLWVMSYLTPKKGRASMEGLVCTVLLLTVYGKPCKFASLFCFSSFCASHFWDCLILLRFLRQSDLLKRPRFVLRLVVKAACHLLAWNSRLAQELCQKIS